MKRLWKQIPPCLSDVLGFEAVLNATDGLGIIDDSSRYKPIGKEKGRHGHHGFYGSEELRVIHSDIRNADIITGTEKKVLAAYEKNVEFTNPAFVLLCHAPSSSMIGSDLEADAEKIRETRHIPAAFVNIDGSRDYLYGISMTLEATGKLLLAKRETISGTVNLLGCSSIDWTEDMRRSAEGWLSDNEFRVLSCWGMKETAETLKASAAAEKNLVVSEAGLRLARYMQREYGIPYVIGAPFGEAACESILNELRGCPAPLSGTDSALPTVLIIGEQLMANALRQSLRKRGHRGIRVVSFFEMDNALTEPGDTRLICEDELSEQINADSVQLIFCNPDMKPLLKKPARWENLPNSTAFSVYEAAAPFDMVESGLDEWLDRERKGGRNR